MIFFWSHIVPVSDNYWSSHLKTIWKLDQGSLNALPAWDHAPGIEDSAPACPILYPPRRFPEAERDPEGKTETLDLIISLLRGMVLNKAWFCVSGVCKKAKLFSSSLQMHIYRCVPLTSLRQEKGSKASILHPSSSLLGAVEKDRTMCLTQLSISSKTLDPKPVRWEVMTTSFGPLGLKQPRTEDRV